LKPTLSSLLEIETGLEPMECFLIQLDTKINDNLTSNTKLFGLVGERNSVGFTATPNGDAIKPTHNYANRRVDRDFMRTLCRK
jgi:Fe(3+) dicitrate transport protein